MKSLPVLGLTTEQQCVLQQMINRRGVVTVNDVKIIAEACDIDNAEAMTLVNGSSREGKQINAMVNDAVSKALTDMLNDDKLFDMLAR